MIDTILFDLDGTLLQFSQEDFINDYFARLGKVFIRMGMDAEASKKAVWVGTKAMALNDGSMLNSKRFWAGFAECLGLTAEKNKEVEAACDKFYTTEFDGVKSVLRPSGISTRLVRELSDRGFTVVLATNPLFPACAVTTRLNWIDLKPDDFRHITHYSNSTYCKPNPGYFNEILAEIKKAPEQCLMAGNHPVEDMGAGKLGMETFLVTDCLENEANVDISSFRRGTLAELEEHLLSLPTLHFTPI